MHFDSLVSHLSLLLVNLLTLHHKCMLSGVSPPSNQWWHPHCHKPVSNTEYILFYRLFPKTTSGIKYHESVFSENRFCYLCAEHLLGYHLSSNIWQRCKLHNWVGVAEPRCRCRSGLNWSLREHWSWEGPWESFWIKSRDQATVPVFQPVIPYRTSQR